MDKEPVRVTALGKAGIGHGWYGMHARKRYWIRKHMKDTACMVFKAQKLSGWSVLLDLYFFLHIHILCFLIGQDVYV